MFVDTAYQLTGNLHFTNVELTDVKQQLQGKYQTYVCALFNELLGNVASSSDHCIIPSSGTSV